MSDLKQQIKTDVVVAAMTEAKSRGFEGDDLVAVTNASLKHIETALAGNYYSGGTFADNLNPDTRNMLEGLGRVSVRSKRVH